MKEPVKIENIQDIYNNITSENFDRFMLDFYKIFHTLAQAKDENDCWREVKLPYYTWIDDGENNIEFGFNKLSKIEL